MKSFTLLMASALLVSSTFLTLADEPFNGKDLNNWEVKKRNEGANKWTVGQPMLDSANPKAFALKPGEGAFANMVTSHGQSWDVYTKQKWGSSRLEVEFMVAQGANSGVYVMGEYEVQILDSYGKEKMGNGDMGAIYGAKPASVNACKKAGEWQKYVIEYQAPRFDAAGKKISNMKFIKVELNGQVIQENIEMKGPTPSGVTGKEAAMGPIMFQGDHGPVAFRTIKITPMDFDGK
jgi:hypothetical protein